MRTTGQGVFAENLLQNLILHLDVTVLMLERSVSDDIHGRLDLIDFELIGWAHFIVGSLPTRPSIHDHWIDDKPVIGSVGTD